MPGPLHQAAQHGLEFTQGQGLGPGIERRVVIEFAELGRARVVRMVPELLAHVPVQADVMEEIVTLEDAVMLDHPVVGLAYKGLENRCGYVGVVEGPEGVADVVQQCAHHILLVAAIAQRARGGLQGVGVAVHRKAAIVAFQ